MGELFGGADLNAVFMELILIAEKAHRCKEDCNNLRSTLESFAPLFTNVVDSSNLGNPTCQAWFQDLHTLLVQARGIVEVCVGKGSQFSFKYVQRGYLSSQLQDIHHRIRDKLSSKGMLATLNIVQESNCKLDIVEEINRKVDTTSRVIDQPHVTQHVPSITVAFENNPFKILKESILSVPRVGIKTIGVKGKGGAGKTLLAKMVNNDEDIQRKYVDGSILWITIGQDKSISSIYGNMAKFLNDNGVYERDISARHLEAQRIYLMEAFKQKRALVILDDIWGNCEKNHPMIYWLDICKGDGSTTLITTRDSKVLDCIGARERIEVESLSKEESWKLFSFCAFQPKTPPSVEVKDIAMEICDECKGLPLALEVIGGAFWETKNARGWKYALSCLKNSKSWTNMALMEDEIFRCLKFSYDVLSVDAKKCFLYFSAFPEDYLISTKQLCSIWHAEELFGSRDVEDSLNTGWLNLVSLADRSLIDLYDDGEHAKVHDVMRDLAMRIIQDAKIGEWAYECQFEPGKTLKTLPKIKETTKRVSFVGTHVAKLDSQLCYTNHNLRICLLSSFKVDHESGFHNSLPEEFLLGVRDLLCLNLDDCHSLMKLPQSIKELKSLRHLDLTGCKSLKELPKSIKELKSLTHLDLSGCESLKELPNNIKELKSLTYLDLSGCESLKELPKSIKELKSLTHLNLSWCTSLKELPESIKELKSLKHLDLSECASLKELPESIKELKSFTHLNLSGCESLKELPESIKELKCLTHLDLSGCESLKELPKSIKELKSLTHLDLSGCKSLKELPESIKELKSLMHLDLSGCESLKELPESIKELKSLKHLDLSECASLKEHPESIKELKSFTHLNLSGCESLKELPESIKELKCLTHLDLSGCESLKELPESIKELKSLTHLDLSGCKSLKELPESIKELKSLTHLNLSWCEFLKELPESIRELKSLTYLNLKRCNSLTELPESIKELKSLTHLDLSGCESLKELPESIKELKSLTHLDLSWCRSLKELPESIKELKSLSHLDLSWCESLKELPESIKELKSLTHLDLRRCRSLKELPESIKELKSLTHLDLSWCKFLKELPESIKELKSLTHLNLKRCNSLTELPRSIKELKSLTHLDLNGCKSLKELLESIKELKSLTHLNLSWCRSLKELPESIKELESLTHLNLSGCTSLKELPESIKELKSLTYLDLSECESLKKLPESIKELKSLTHLDLRWCKPMEEPLESIKELKSLTHLDLSGCESLKELPESTKELKCPTHLNLSGCYSLTELPKSIKELKSLTYLDLSGCKSLKELPESIKELKSLTHLDLRECWALKELPESIKELKSLTHLDLTECWALKELPESIKELKSLTHLDLSGCESLKELPESIKELKSLMHLDLSGCESLKELPESIKELKSLTHLDLRECWALKELPESIKELKSLTHLDLSWCRSLKELLESIKELKSLTHLDLSGCESLKELPESIKELKSLTHLDLRECWALKELLESIKELKSLTHLDLSWCRSLKELPESIKELKSLTHLDLSGCESLKELPESIKELKSLTHLDLRRCRSLKELPESIKELKSLTHLDLSWCTSLKELPENIKELKSLTHLNVSNCWSLKGLPEIMKELESRMHLDLRLFASLKELPESIKELKSRMHLDNLVDLNESIPTEELNILRCSTSSSYNLFSDDECTRFINALKKEVLEMDNICEVSSNHETLSSVLHGEAEIVTFCYYDTKEDQFEFYFKDSQDMANVVGVGLQYAKAILDKGCKIKVKEISKLEWEQTLSQVQSNTTCVFKTLKLELPRLGGVGDDTNYTGRPLLWDLAQYFILKEIVTAFANHCDGVSSSNQPSSSEKSSLSNTSDLLALCNILRKLIIDGEDAKNPKPEGEPPSPNHPRALDENCSAIVAIQLLEGGKIVNANLKPKMKEKLKVLDESILPNLEFKFSNHDGFKTIQSTIGKICFNLDEEEKWRHYMMNVSFSLLGENQDYGEVERYSFKQLDLDLRSGTESTKLTRKLENKEGNGNATAWKASAIPLGFGGSVDCNYTNSKDDTDSCQFEAGSERKSDYTTGGLYTKMFANKHKIACKYYSLDTQDYYKLQPTAPSCRSQIVEFQGLWNIIDYHRDLPAGSLVEYKLMVSRCLAELTPEESDGESESNEFNQVYEKKILLNHGMTQLNGRRHNLRELFQASRWTFLVEKGSRDEYKWRDSRGDEINPLAAIRGPSARARGHQM